MLIVLILINNKTKGNKMKLKRIWKKKTIEGCTEEFHSQETKDGRFSVGIELNYSFPPFVYNRREFDYGRYTVYIQKGDKIVHEITENCPTAKCGLDLFKKAKLWVQKQN
jgi:hypothetical protein